MRGRSICPVPALRPVKIGEARVERIHWFPWLNNPQTSGPIGVGDHEWVVQTWAERWVERWAYRPDRCGDT
jgi:hypothetical protein